MNESVNRPNQLHDLRLRQHLAQAYLDVQRKYEDEGRMPRGGGTVLTLYRVFWEIVGAIHLGILITAISIVMNFILINFLLHLAPA